MRMVKRVFLATLLVIALGHARNSVAASFVNGSFETGDTTGWVTDSSYGLNPFGTIYGSGFNGKYWAWVAGYEGSIYFNQTVTGLTAGTKYAVDFLIASEFTKSDSIFVSADGGPSQQFFAPAMNSNFWDNWVSREFDFTATGTTALISFSTHGVDPNSQYDIGLDNVTIRELNQPVPEPSTFLLFGVGLAGVGFLRRRAKK